MFNLRCTALRVISVCEMMYWSPKQIALQNDHEVPQKSKKSLSDQFYHTGTRLTQ